MTANLAIVSNNTQMSVTETLLSGFSSTDLFPMSEEMTSISLVNVAMALSNRCCYEGWLPAFYSEAQRSLIMSYVLEDVIGPEGAKVGALLSAGRLYARDEILPGGYAEYPSTLTLRATRRIFQSFGVNHLLLANRDVIREVQNMVATEMRDLVPDRKHVVIPGRPDPEFSIQLMGARAAHRLYAERLMELFPEHVGPDDFAEFY